MDDKEKGNKKSIMINRLNLTTGPNHVYFHLSPCLPHQNISFMFAFKKLQQSYNSLKKYTDRAN